MRICVTQVFLTFLSRRHPNQISKWTDFKWEKYMQANKTDLSVKREVHAASLKGLRSCNNAFSSTDAPSPFACALAGRDRLSLTLQQLTHSPQSAVGMGCLPFSVIVSYCHVFYPWLDYKILEGPWGGQCIFNFCNNWHSALNTARA